MIWAEDSVIAKCNPKQAEMYRKKSVEEEGANAAFIVKAVNNHYQLLEALKGLSEVCQCENGCKENDMTCASNLAREAIKQAEAE